MKLLCWMEKGVGGDGGGGVEGVAGKRSGVERQAERIRRNLKRREREST